MNVEPEGREGPLEKSSDNDDFPGSISVSEEEIEEFRRVVLRQMRKQAPHLYVVLKAWRDERALRSEPSQYRHGVSRGFYSRLAKQLGLERQSVLYRLRMAMQLAADLLQRHEQSKKA